MSSSRNDNNENSERKGKTSGQNKTKETSRTSTSLVRYRSLPNLNFSTLRHCDNLLTDIVTENENTAAAGSVTNSNSEIVPASVPLPERRLRENARQQTGTPNENFYYSAGIHESGRGQLVYFNCITVSPSTSRLGSSSGRGFTMNFPHRTCNFGALGNAPESGYAMRPQPQQIIQPSGSIGTPQTFNYGANILNFNFMNGGQYDVNLTTGNGYGINAPPPVPPHHAVPIAPTPTTTTDINAVPQFRVNGSVAGLASTSSMYPNPNISGGYAFNSSLHADPMTSTFNAPGAGGQVRTPIRYGGCQPYCQPPHNHTDSSNLAFQHMYRDVGPTYPSVSQSQSSLEDDVFEDDQDWRGGGSQNSIKSAPFGFSNGF